MNLQGRREKQQARSAAELQNNNNNNNNNKCANATFKRGKKVSAEGILLNDHQLIQDLDQAEAYKYLGMEEGEGVQHHQMKVKIKEEYKRQIKLVLNSELNARNRIAAINTLAVPVVLYSYGIIDWKLNEI